MSLEFRRDGRPLPVFEKYIYVNTKRENLWAEILKVNLEEKGCKVIVIDNGIDGTGKIVKKSSKDLSKVDKIYVINGKRIPVEIKTCDRNKDFCEDVKECELDYITIKVNSLRACIEQEAIMIICDRKWRMILRPPIIEKLLEDFTPGIYHNFAKNTLCIRVNRSKFKKYMIEKEGKFHHKDKIQVCRWCDKAKKIIAENQKILFKKKHQI